ncbi:uncharacterized protein LOC8283421 isoform X2 [Ricinus communis]|uniref:uncharacterized protein LOC8283421 isoform X2 n=1 Tax=Ricinus communis TaxID=3988 RepID=UPI00201B2AFD|nr:uncharacterized protein LOC8283421 isoform X2 [Ricinus communis]XP_048230196.1 uncharacterized protein LOC8283421 isoform X2 [Ricinus communis]XP_048230197.1 uncharacterized protein LOC8283421 isoform X2 [Ricinus communis]
MGWFSLNLVAAWKCLQLLIFKSAQSSMGMVQPPSFQKNQSSLGAPGAIFWDMENCPVPRGVLAQDVALHTRKAFGVSPIKRFTAFGDLNGFSMRTKEELHRSGVELNYVPRGRKDAADKAILSGVYTFALDNPPPACIMLISGDADFAQVLNTVSQRGYYVFLATPAGVNVSSALINASDLVYDWPSVACGKVVLSFSSALMCRYPAATDTVGCCRGYLDGEGTGETNAIKGEVKKLVELSGGSLPLAYLPGDYKKYYGRPLYEAESGEDGGLKLLSLLQKMSDELAIVDKGGMQFVYLRNWKAETSCAFIM